MLYEQEGDLTDLMVMTPGSLVFSLVGADEDRRSTGPTRQLTAEEKAALRLHVGDKTLHFADANELDWGHYEWQTPDLVWASGDSIPLALSMPAAFMQRCGALPDEIWCTTMTVGTSGVLSGFSEGDSRGSLSSATFSYGGTSYEVTYLGYDSSGRQFRFSISPNSGVPVFNIAGFGVHAGVLSVALPAGQPIQSIGSLLWDGIPDPGWSNGDQVVVRLTGPGDAQVQVGDPPTIEGLPAIGGVGSNSVWDAGDTAKVTFTFSEAVDVDTTGGTPTVGFDLGGTKLRSATFASGSGTTELVFEYDVVEADGSNSIASMTGNNLALNGGTIRSSATQVDADLAHQGVLVQGASASAKSDETPSVTFENLPRSHDGSSPFAVELSFSGTPQGLRAKSDASSVLDVTGGSVAGARDVSQNGQPRWEVSIDPDGAGDVHLEIPARGCTETGAVCVNGQPLAEAVEATVPGPGTSGQDATADPITASWSSVPEGHDASSTFDVHLDFSRNPQGLSYRAIEGGVVSVEGGAIARVWRRTRGGDNREWGIEVNPSGDGAVTLTVNATTDCAAQHAVCAEDGGMLEGGAQATIAGPPPETITASWSSVPAEHDGNSTFDVHLDFSRNPKGLSYESIEGGVVSVAGGAIERAWRRIRGGDNRQWGIEVNPSGNAPVTLTVNGTTDCEAEHAVCAADGGMLEGGRQAAIGTRAPAKPSTR